MLASRTPIDPKISPFGNGNHTIYKDGDDLGMVYDGLWHCVTHIRQKKNIQKSGWAQGIFHRAVVVLSFQALSEEVAALRHEGGLWKGRWSMT